MKTYSSKELLTLSRRETNARKRIRLLAISLFVGGESISQISIRLNVARSSVYSWVQRYLSKGLSGLNNKSGAGRPRQLTARQLEKLKRYMQFQAQSCKGGMLTGVDTGDYIDTQFNVRYNSGHVYKVIKSIGFNWITTRSKHPKQSQSAQNTFKKISLGNDP